MAASIPRLREGVNIQRSPISGTMAAVLSDPALGRRLRLDETVAAVAEALDGQRDAEQLAEALQLEVESVRRAADFLRGQALLATPEAQAVVQGAARAAAYAASPQDAPLIIRHDAAFTCTMCGSCCGGHNVGPVKQDVLDGLGPHLNDLAAETGTKKGLFFTVPIRTAEGYAEQVVCQSSEGSCVFLANDNKCTIHRRLGGHMKPRVCRVFPYQFVATPEGIAVSLQMECRGFVDARQGAALKTQETDLRALMAHANVRPVRPVTVLDGANTLDWTAYSALEDRLHTALDEHKDDATQALLAMRAVLAEPLEAPRAGLDVPSLRGALDQMGVGIRETVASLRALFHQDDPQGVVHTGSLDELDCALIHMTAQLPRMLRPLRKAGQRRLFVEMVHHHLQNKDLTHARSLRIGFGRLVLLWLLARSLMLQRARQVKRAHLTEQDVLDAMVLVRFLMRNQDFMSALRTHDEACAQLLFDRLPQLVALADELPDPDRRLELYKF